MVDQSFGIVYQLKYLGSMASATSAPLWSVKFALYSFSHGWRLRAHNCTALGCASGIVALLLLDRSAWPAGDEVEGGWIH